MPTASCLEGGHSSPDIATRGDTIIGQQVRAGAATPVCRMRQPARKPMLLNQFGRNCRGSIWGAPIERTELSSDLWTKDKFLKQRAPRQGSAVLVSAPVAD
jgi:hypothetical protein